MALVMVKQVALEYKIRNDYVVLDNIASFFEVPGDTVEEKRFHAFYNVPRHHPDVIRILKEHGGSSNFNCVDIVGNLYRINRTRISNIDEIVEELVTIEELDNDTNNLCF